MSNDANTTVPLDQNADLMSVWTGTPELDPQVTGNSQSGIDEQNLTRTATTLDQELRASVRRELEEELQAEMKEQLRATEERLRKEIFEMLSKQNSAPSTSPLISLDESTGTKQSSKKGPEEGAKGNKDPELPPTVERKHEGAQTVPEAARGRSEAVSNRRQVQIAQATPVQTIRARDTSPETGTLPTLRRAGKLSQSYKLKQPKLFDATQVAPGTGMMYSEVLGDEFSEEPTSEEEAAESPTARFSSYGSASRAQAHVQGSDSESVSEDETRQYRQREVSEEYPDEGFGQFHTVTRKKDSRKIPIGGEIPNAQDKFTKLPKVEASEKYSGKDDKPITLKRFCDDMLMRFKAQGIEENGMYGTMLILQNLTGTAGEWASREIQEDLQAAFPRSSKVNLNAVRSPWSLNRIRNELQKRFVSPDDHARAEAEWRMLTQTPKNGKRLTVQQLETKLREIAERRIQTTPVDRKSKFVNALSTEVAADLHRARHLRGWELNPAIRLHDLVSEAINIEQTLNLLKAREAERNSESKRENFELMRSKRKESAPEPKQGAARNKPARAASSRASAPKATSSTPVSAEEKARRARKAERERLYEHRQKNGLCRWCGGDDHMRADCEDPEAVEAWEFGKKQKAKAKKNAPEKPEVRATEIREIREIAADPDVEGGGAYQRPLLAPLGLNGRDGFQALVDTGASHTVMKSSIPMLLGVKVKSYTKPVKVKMSAKGSQVTAYKYVEMPMTICGITKNWRFILLNIEEDAVIGRDFCRPYGVVIEFNPDRIWLREKEPKPTPARSPKRRLAHEKGKERTLDTLLRTNEPSPYPSDSPPPHPDPTEPEPVKLREYTLFKFESSKHSEERGDDPDWLAPRELIEEFRDELLEEYRQKGVILQAEEILPCPPHRGQLDHEVPYYDETKKVPPALAYPWSRAQKQPMIEMIEGYEKGGQFVPTALDATAPLVPKLKKNGKGRPVNDLRKRNALTKPLPMQPVDVDSMLNSIATAKYTMGADLKKAFEQIRAAEKAQPKNVVATPIGNFIVRTAMQGDRNSATSLQRMINFVFHGMVGKELSPYADDNWIHTQTWNSFKRACGDFFARCYQWSLVVSEESIQFCPAEAEVLGRVIKNGEISMSPKQIDAIRNYVQPKTQKSLRRFLGITNFHLPFVPHLAELAAPLYDLAGDVPFRWTATHDLSFQRTKEAVAMDCKLAAFDEKSLAPQGTSPVHRSAPPKPSETVQNEAKGNYLFVFTDASVVGTSGVLAVGENWWSARPLGYCSRKHDTARSRWGAYKQELVAPVNACEVWKDVLSNHHIVFVTDNESVSKLNEQTSREEFQAKIAEKLGVFDHEICWIEGQYNVAADALSRQYEDGDPALPESHRVFNLLEEEDADGKIREFRAIGRPERAKRAPAHHADYVVEPEYRPRPTAPELGEPEESGDDDLPDLLALPEPPEMPEAEPIAAAVQFDDDQQSAAGEKEREELANAPAASTPRSDPNATEAAPRPKKRKRAKRKGRSKRMTTEELREELAWEKAEAEPSEDWLPRFEAARKSALESDPLFGKVLSDLDAYADYKLDKKSLLWQNDREVGDRLCLPAGTFEGRSFREIYTEHYHSVLGHQSDRITLHHMRQHVWWPNMVKEVEAYCRTCASCQASKHERAAPRGKLHPVQLPHNAYEQISIDFTGPHPVSTDADGVQRDYIFTFIDAATGEVRLIPCTKAGLTSAKCAQIYLDKVYPLWGIPRVILSDQDVRWVSAFWKAFHEALGTTLHMSTAYHPQSNGKIERMHAVLNSMLRQLIKENQSDWVSHLPLVEIAINSSRNASGFSPYELTRVFQPSLTLPLAEPAREVSAQNLLEKAKRRNEIARDILTKARIERAYYANRKRRPDHVPRTDNDGTIQEWYWVRTANWRTVPERSRSLCPPFDGPFRCLSYDSSNSTYTLDLPTRYTQRGIATKFHASQLKPYVKSDEVLFPGRVHDSIPIFPLDALEDPQMNAAEAEPHSNHDASNVWEYLSWEWENDETCILTFKGRNTATNAFLNGQAVEAGTNGHHVHTIGDRKGSQKLADAVSKVSRTGSDWTDLPKPGGKWPEKGKVQRAMPREAKATARADEKLTKSPARRKQNRSSTRTNDGTTPAHTNPPACTIPPARPLPLSTSYANETKRTAKVSTSASEKDNSTPRQKKSASGRTSSAKSTTRSSARSPDNSRARPKATKTASSCASTTKRAKSRHESATSERPTTSNPTVPRTTSSAASRPSRQPYRHKDKNPRSRPKKPTDSSTTKSRPWACSTTENSLSKEEILDSLGSACAQIQ